jgi:hypothetical protein
MDISAETFQSITRSLKSDGGSDKRRSPRVGVRGHVTIVPLPKNPSNETLSVILRNISAQGMAILHHKPMDAGQRFILRLEAQSHSAQTQAIVCTVVRCHALEDSLYEIGVEFVGELSSNTSDTGVMLASDSFGQATPESRALEDRVKNAILGDSPKRPTPAPATPPATAPTKPAPQASVPPAAAKSAA